MVFYHNLLYRYVIIFEINLYPYYVSACVHVIGTRGTV